MMKTLRILVFALLALMPIAAYSQGDFSGVWRKTSGAFSCAGNEYLRFTKIGTAKYKLGTGFEYNGQASWNTDALDIKGADGIYLRPVGNKLVAKFVSSNFCATHSMEFTYRITAQLKSGKLYVSQWSSISGETENGVFTKIGSR